MKTALDIADMVGAKNVVGNDWLYYKKINGEWIGKQAIQCRRLDNTTYTDWFEACDKSLIDTRYYNLDGSKK